MTKRGNEVECVGTVAPDSKLNLPLDAVYTPTNVHGLFFSVEGYNIFIQNFICFILFLSLFKYYLNLIFFSRYMVSEQFIWKDLQKTISMTKLLKCEARIRQEIVEPFYIKVIKSNIFIYLYT